MRTKLINRPTNLEAIMEFWAGNRAVGNTYVSFRGLAAFDRQVIFVTMNNPKDYPHQNKNIIFMHPGPGLPEKLRGMRCPLVVDHFAMINIFHNHQEEMAKRYEKNN